MPFEVLRTPQVTAALRRMSVREKRAYEAARDSLRGEGCKAGGYRMLDALGDDYPLCCRHLAFAWRMFTAYLADGRIVIAMLDKHDRGHNPAAELVEVLPGLSTIGRRRADKPPCCEDAADPPAMNDELSKFLAAFK